MAELHEDCCIYRGPFYVSKENETFYVPKEISIGPFYHGGNKLEYMEGHKKRYHTEFSRQTSTEKLKEFKIFIKSHEQDIRNCYSEQFKLLSNKFITIILYDAIFIIELFLKFYENKRDEKLKRSMQDLHDIKIDLQVIGNQLPYFILEKLYKIVFGNQGQTYNGMVYPSFLTLSCNFFLGSTSDCLGVSEQVKIKHFIDLRRYVVLRGFPPQASAESNIGRTVILGLPGACKLYKSGVKFKAVDGDSINIKFEKKGRLFEKAELQIPKFVVDIGTECLFHNVIVFEQYCYNFETHFRNYILLLGSLIQDENDAYLLMRKKIMDAQSHRYDVVKMFKKLRQEYASTGSYYYHIAQALKAFYFNDDPINHASTSGSCCLL
ncbi:hypothetical protein Dsin_003338 [Dipteronia sinensis]|uniref:Uncharacterized protein n=1 Tax=Dipteronia sinensis TaxID=43782 RepID=A0AAE0EKU6_9ROSI|nr:hypothetical protein Dsin_003338 [Dipteronia sinensis]